MSSWVSTKREKKLSLSVEGGSHGPRVSLCITVSLPKLSPTSVTVTVGLRPCATFVFCSLNFPFLPKLLPQFPKQNLSSGIYVLSQVCLGEEVG